MPRNAMFGSGRRPGRSMFVSTILDVYKVRRQLLRMKVWSRGRARMVISFLACKYSIYIFCHYLSQGVFVY